MLEILFPQKWLKNNENKKLSDDHSIPSSDHETTGPFTPIFRSGWQDDGSPKDLDHGTEMLLKKSDAKERDASSDLVETGSEVRAVLDMLSKRRAGGSEDGRLALIEQFAVRKTDAGLGSEEQKPSSFRKRSIAIGNGWNAKGLEKAKQGDWSRAIQSWENALQVRTQVLGESHPDVANTCNNMGIALGNSGRFDEAFHYLERALVIRVFNNGHVHPEVAATVHNIGNVFQQEGEMALAVHCFFQAKLLLQNDKTDQVDGNYRQVARCSVAIGHAFYQEGAYKPAREAYREALAILRANIDDDDDAEVQQLMADIQEIDRMGV